MKKKRDPENPRHDPKPGAIDPNTGEPEKGAPEVGNPDLPVQDANDGDEPFPPPPGTPVTTD